VNFVRIACPGALAGAIAAALAVILAAAPEAAAFDEWLDGQPNFRSDYLREQRRLERERDDSRRQYQVNFPPYMEGGPQPAIRPVAPPIVPLGRSERPGTIIIDSGGKRLYYVLAPGNKAYEYPISVGREGFAWTGVERISRIQSWPSWHPPAEMRQREPGLPIVMTGGINNPLGALALYLGNTLYRIHGTNDPRTIGRAQSSGCFRMMNEHVLHLASMAGVGTEVRVVARYRGADS
jgi:lipoprotein-anchoring transpeptidase ErfK/SrfK